jgi:hypothetical protein
MKREVCNQGWLEKPKRIKICGALAFPVYMVVLVPVGGFR